MHYRPFADMAGSVPEPKSAKTVILIVIGVLAFLILLSLFVKYSSYIVLLRIRRTQRKEGQKQGEK